MSAQLKMLHAIDCRVRRTDGQTMSAQLKMLHAIGEHCNALYEADGSDADTYEPMKKAIKAVIVSLESLTTKLAAVKAERDALKVDSARLEFLFYFAQKKLGDKAEALADALIKANNMTEFRAAIDAIFDNSIADRQREIEKGNP